MQNFKAKPKKKGVLGKSAVYCGKWINFLIADYKIKEDSDATFQYEYIERTTKPKQAECDAIVIIPILVSKKGKLRQILMISCFRPPVNDYVLEFPAGLLESGNIYENAARELKEETGYTMNRMLVPCDQPDIASYLDPGLVASNAKSIVCEVDLDAPENQNV